LDPIVDVPYVWFKAHITFRVLNFIFYGLMVLEILGLELYSNLARKKILKPWKKAALLTFYLCVIAQAVGTRHFLSRTRTTAHAPPHTHHRTRTTAQLHTHHRTRTSLTFPALHAQCASC
jgi:hypothetical protein